MRTIDIAVTKARLTSMRIEFPEVETDFPVVHAYLTLYGENGKQITTTEIGTGKYEQQWNKDRYADLPVNALPWIGALREMFEEIITAHTQRAYKQLPSMAVVVEEDM